MKFKQIVLVIPFLIFAVLSYSNGSEEGVESDFHFTENKGQFDEQTKYLCMLHIGEIRFNDNSFTFDLFSAEELSSFYESRHHHKTHEVSNSDKLNKHVYNMKFLGANSNNTIVPLKKKSSYKNYFRGNDPNKWASNVQSYKKITYLNLYDGIDVNVYSINNHLKYDFIVAKESKTEDIKIEYEGVDELVLVNGTLEIILSNGIVRELRPVAYQIVNDERIDVSCDFVVDDNVVSFNFPNGYDSSIELIIDPTLVFASLTGSPSDNWGFTATYDSLGNFYSGSIVLGSGLGPNFGSTATYPTTGGAYQTTFGAFVDVAISKFSANGASLIYSTYLGGTEMEEPHSLICDDQSNLIVMGATSSTNFPTTSGAFQTSFWGGTFISNLDGINWNNGSDIFVTKLNAAGSALLGSTYLGGAGNDGLSLDIQLNYNYADHARGEVILDMNNNIYISSSSNSSNFPTTSSSHSQTLFGGYDAVVCKLNPTLTTLEWSTYLGGTQGDAGYSIRVDVVNDKTFICGGTENSGLATAGVLNTTYAGAIDGYIAKLDNTNGSLDALTYLGTNSYDQAYIIELDKYQNVYVVGQTNGNYPVTGGVYSNVGANQFIHKLNNNLTITDFSTVFGSANSSTINISLTAFLVDNCDNIYVGGWGGNVNAGFGNGTTFNMPITAGAVQSTTDGSDFYFIVLDSDAQNLLYGTYFGSSTADEHVDGGTSRFDKKGTIYQAVCAACGGNSFPTTSGAYSTTNGSTNCNFGAIKIDMNFQGVVATANPPPNLIMCGAPYNVNFTGNTPSPPNSYWDFGDGVGTSILPNPVYNFPDTGSYTVMYVAIDSTTCNITDTVYFNVTVLMNDTLDAQFNFPQYDPCTDSLTIQLDFTGSGADSLFWNMGNGTTFFNDTSVTYTYTTSGTYIVTLEAYDLLCSNTFILTDTVFFNPVLSTVNANPPDSIFSCTTLLVNFTGNVPASPNSYWDFGDGIGTSTQNNPIYTYDTSGTYLVMYVAIDSLTCNITDTAWFNVQLVQAPPFSATIDFDPPPPCGLDSFLVELEFTGVGADSLIWDLGDGTQIANNNSVIYLYSNEGAYTITMTAYNFLCGNRTVISEVEFIESQETESVIPNVFTPNDDGMNDVLEFVGVDGTEEYSIQIFNRWGTKIYEGTDALAHWNGGGHEEGTYFYILKYTDECSDEEQISKGYVTLLK